MYLNGRVAKTVYSLIDNYLATGLLKTTSPKHVWLWVSKKSQRSPMIFNFKEKSRAPIRTFLFV